MVRTILIIFLCITFLGCSKESLVVVQQPKSYNVILVTKGLVEDKSETTSVKSGEVMVYKLVKYADRIPVSVSINNQVQPLLESYNITVVTNTNVVTQYISIYEYNLTNGSDTKTNPWYLGSIEYYDINGNFLRRSNLNQTPESLTNEYFFYLNGKCELFSKEGVLVGNGTWSIKGAVFNDSGRNLEINVLTATEFSYTQPITQNNGTVEKVKMTLYKKIL
jgi:hypothetical protein